MKTILMLAWLCVAPILSGAGAAAILLVLTWRFMPGPQSPYAEYYGIIVAGPAFAIGAMALCIQVARPVFRLQNVVRPQREEEYIVIAQETNRLDERQARAVATAMGGEAWQTGGRVWLTVIRRDDGKTVVYVNDEAFEK